MRAEALPLVLLLATVAVAGPVEERADEVAGACAAQDAAKLKDLAADDAPDPWLVVDELCFRGALDAAAAFAAAAPRPDTERLPAYVDATRTRRSDRTMRDALALCDKALLAGKPEEALAAIDGAPSDGLDVVSVRVVTGRGVALRNLRRLEEAAAAFLAAAAGAERLGWLARVAVTLHEGGSCAYDRSDLPGALEAWQRRLRCEEARGNRPGVASGLMNLSVIHTGVGAYAEALQCSERALKLYEESGDRGRMAMVLGNLGAIQYRLGAYNEALTCQERALQLAEELGDPAGMASALSNMGAIHHCLGGYAKALDHQERALRLQEELGDQRGAANTLGSIGITHAMLADYRKAREYEERALALKESLGDRAGIAQTLGDLGVLHYDLGEYRKALACQERSLMLAGEIGDRLRVAMALGNIGAIQGRLGAYALALDRHERALEEMEALGNPALAAMALGNLGNLHASLGAHAKALEYLERAMKGMDDAGDRAGVATSLVNIGNVHRDLGEHGKSLDCLVRGLKLGEEIGDRATVASALGSIGATYGRLGEHAEALAWLERALKAREEIGDQAGIAATLEGIGAAHGRLGAHSKALDHCERARALALELGCRETEILALGDLASVHLARGDAARAVGLSREAVGKVALLATRLSEELGVSARDPWSDLVETGVRAATALADPAEVSFFLESGRAQALLESLGGRDRIGDAALPPALLDAELEARAAVAAATAGVARARAGGEVAEIRATRAALDEAQRGLLEAVGRIQREAKESADVACPKAAPLEQIRASLREGEALVSYALLSRDAIALVVTAEGARLVELGRADKLEQVVVALSIGTPEKPWRDAAKRARELLIDRLGLGERTRRLLVSPDGALAYVPFGLLAEEREVALVPSGTTYALLLGEARRRGEAVLALGDPACDAAPDAAALAVLRRGERLPRLPGTRGEAKAVGDEVLLGPEASERGLAAALARRPRWRAVHLACHGLVDPERPQLSALALAPGGGDDGFLTTIEVLRMRFPADLVVLSACETARGKVYRTEGVVGFVRAFMFAGAPRVIVSLWKVDDEATRALMGKFYELWKADTPTARALRDAQAFVRAQEKWNHPRYWAAWVLWGLPD